MSDHDAFLRAVRATPDDDTPRLAFADWLDEHGQPDRAEFVRVQIELAPVRDQLERPRVAELRAREAALLAAHRAEWLGAAADVEAAAPAFGPVFRRGFPELVCLRLDTFLARGEDLFAACPTLREVAVFDTARRRALLAVSPLLGRIETLEIAETICWADESPDVLLAALRDAGVHRLRVPGVWNSWTGGLVGRYNRKSADTCPRELELVAHRRLINEPPADVVGRVPRMRVLRPGERRFPVAGGDPEDVYAGWEHGRAALGRQLLAGHVKGVPVLVAVRLTDRSSPHVDHAEVRALFFDADGRVTGQQTYPVSAMTAWAREGTDHSLGYFITKWIRDDLRFEPGVIRVRAFDAGEGLSLRPWPARYRGYFNVESDSLPEGVTSSEWRDRGGEVRRWLHEGTFVVNWDDTEFVFDDAGQPVTPRVRNEPEE